jgi:hypothetical protein
MGGGSDEYRLVWFHHLHKSAGTLIVNMALRNGEVPYPSHGNGNPKGEDGVLLPIWEYDEGTLESFIDECEREGVTFVATEHGAPDFGVLIGDPRVLLVTCLRDPLKRCASNFNYAYYSGYTDAPSMVDFALEPNVHMSDNYYTRMFSRMEQLPLVGIGEDSLSSALETVSGFDLVLSTDPSHMDMASAMSESLGWVGMGSVDRHSTFGDGWRMVNMLKKLQFGRLLRYVSKRDMSEGVDSLRPNYELDYRMMAELF